MSQRHPNVNNINDIEPRVVEKGTKFGFSGKRLGAASGNTALGCGYFEVPPGRCAFPNHFHCAIEEGIYIIEGEGEARIGKDTVKIGTGDYIAYPAGPEYSHSLKNTGKTALKYLCLSNISTTDVVGYPDSKKIAGVGCMDPITGFKDAKVLFIHKEQPSVDYYEGEEIG